MLANWNGAGSKMPVYFVGEISKDWREALEGKRDAKTSCDQDAVV